MIAISRDVGAGRSVVHNAVQLPHKCLFGDRRVTGACLNNADLPYELNSAATLSGYPLRTWIRQPAVMLFSPPPTAGD